MKCLLAEVLERINAQRSRLHFALNSFRQVLVADGSVIRLHEALAPVFPSIWTNHMPASAKLACTASRSTSTGHSTTRAARWEIELLFRELKTQYRIDDLRSRSRHVTECLLYASLLTLAVSRRLHRLLAPNPNRLPQRHPFDRWAVLFSALSRDLLDLTVGPISQRAFIAGRLRRFLLHDAPAPNRRRLLLPVRAQLGQFGALA